MWETGVWRHLPSWATSWPAARWMESHYTGTPEWKVNTRSKVTLMIQCSTHLIMMRFVIHQKNRNRSTRAVHGYSVWKPNHSIHICIIYGVGCCTLCLFVLSNPHNLYMTELLICLIYCMLNLWIFKSLTSCRIASS